MADELAPYVIKRLDGLKRSESIGAGSYGVVCEVKVNGLPCIAKRLHDVLTNKQSVSPQERRAIGERFRDECILLSRLRHPNIVQFLGVHYGKDRYDLTLVMERMHIDLETALEKFPNMSLPVKLRILLDASYGLLHLHCQTPPIVHRDFTAANILLSPDMRAKVADLGVSKILDLSPQQFSKHTKCPGALGYMPPEALQQNPVYGVRLDMFSFGHLTLYAVNQQYPEVHELGPEGYKAVQNGTAQLAKRKIAVDKMGKDHCLYQLVTTCLQDSPKKRPTAAHVNSTLHDLATQQPVKDLYATAVILNEERKEEISKEVEELREKLHVADEDLEYYRNLVDSVIAVKKKSDASVQEALEEAKVTFDEAQEYKKQANSFKQQAAQREKENLDLVQEITRISHELKITKDKMRKMEDKKTKKFSTGRDAPMPSPVIKVSMPGTVPEELYRKIEADYDRALQDKAEMQMELNEVKEAYKALKDLLSKYQKQLPLFQPTDAVLPIPEEPPPPSQIGKAPHTSAVQTPQYQPPNGRVSQQPSWASACLVPPVHTNTGPAPMIAETPLQELIRKRGLRASHTPAVQSYNAVPPSTSMGSQPPVHSQIHTQCTQELVPQPIPTSHTLSTNVFSQNQCSTVVSQMPPYHPQASPVVSTAVTGDLSLMKGLDSDIRKPDAVAEKPSLESKLPPDSAW